MKFTSKFGQNHYAILSLQGKRFKMFEMRFSRFWKCLNTAWNSPSQPVE